MPDPNNSNIPQVDPDTAAKIAALATRNGGSQPQSTSAPAAGPAQDTMNMAMSAMNNPLAQAVPQSPGIIDPTQHPVVAALIKLLSGAAQAYGWTGQPPEQRLQRQQMEQQKAEAMA